MSSICFVTQYQLPQELVNALSFYGYTVTVCCQLSELNTEQYSTVVVDTSQPRQELLDIRSSLPTHVCSFYFRLSDLCASTFGRRQIARLISMIDGDISINHQSYEFVGETQIPTEYGKFLLFGFQSRIGGNNILGLRTPVIPRIPLVRVHSMCYTGDIFHSLKCDCREELENSLHLIHEQGGMLIYPEEEGRGIGILNKIRIYKKQEEGADTVEAQHLGNFPNDLRTYDYLREVFAFYSLCEIRLITNNPDKTAACFNSGVCVTEIVKLPSTITEHNRGYLETKMLKSGHNFSLEFNTC